MALILPEHFGDQVNDLGAIIRAKQSTLKESDVQMLDREGLLLACEMMQSCLELDIQSSCNEIIDKADREEIIKIISDDRMYRAFLKLEKFIFDCHGIDQNTTDQLIRIINYIRHGHGMPEEALEYGEYIGQRFYQFSREVCELAQDIRNRDKADYDKSKAHTKQVKTLSASILLLNAGAAMFVLPIAPATLAASIAIGGLGSSL